MRILPARKVWQVILLQLGLTILVAAGLLMSDKVLSVSGLAGGLAATAGNAIFASVVFRRHSKQEPGRLLGSYYAAEFIKLALTALIFLIAILFFKKVSIAAMLGVYLVVHLASTFFVIAVGRE